MQPITVVAKALDALNARDLDRHMRYFAEDMVMGEGFKLHDGGRDKAAYCALVAKLSQYPGGADLLPRKINAMPTASTDNVEWVHAVVQFRYLFSDFEGNPTPITGLSDWFFAVQDDKIRIIKASGGSTIAFGVYKG
jgi:hypothetical protein